MQSMKLDPKLVPLIKRGVKSATIRKGVKSSLSLGPLTFVNNNFCLEVFVTEIKAVQFRSLAWSHAHAEGYEDVTHLQAALRHYYPDLKQDDWLTVIRFEQSPPKGSGFGDHLKPEQRQGLLDDLRDEVADWDNKVLYNTMKSAWREAMEKNNDIDLIDQHHFDVLKLQSDEKCEEPECPLCKEKK